MKPFWIAKDPYGGLVPCQCGFFRSKPVIKEEMFHGLGGPSLGKTWMHKNNDPVGCYSFLYEDFVKLFGVRVTNGKCKKVRIRRSNRSNCCIKFKVSEWYPGGIRTEEGRKIFIAFYKNRKFVDRLPYHYFIEYTHFDFTFDEIEKNNFINIVMEEI